MNIAESSRLFGMLTFHVGKWMSLALLLLPASAAPAGSSEPAVSGRVFWTDTVEHVIKSAKLDWTDVQTLVAEPIVYNSRGIALDVEGGFIYWTESNAPFGVGISRASLIDGSGPTTLISLPPEQGRPYGIALDLAGGKMYFAVRNGVAGTIQRANLDGANREFLVFAQDTPWEIELDLKARVMYWTLRNAVRRYSMDGPFPATTVETIVSSESGSGAYVVSGMGQCSGLALDVAAEMMYWTDFRTSEIRRASMNGAGTVETLPITGLVEAHGAALDLRAKNLYFVDGISIFRCNLDGTDVEQGPSTTSPYAVDVIPAASNPADLNHDGQVSGLDLAILLAAWGACPPKGACAADLNHDDVVSGLDLAMLLGVWG